MSLNNLRGGGDQCTSDVEQTPEDDLESLYYVMLYCALRYLGHDLDADKRSEWILTRTWLRRGWE